MVLGVVAAADPDGAADPVVLPDQGDFVLFLLISSATLYVAGVLLRLDGLPSLVFQFGTSLIVCGLLCFLVLVRVLLFGRKQLD
ncbi:hypothetical protein [Candidatus Ichthyocystis sparus]|nr:hypothetical protein [Candidatus Ichthyocystis sparus]